MEIERLENGDFAIKGLERTLAEILLILPSSTDPGESEAARRRLFPELTTDADAASMQAEWEEFVVPDLQQAFQDSTEIARRDLSPLHEGGGEFLIPARHVDAWLSALNQARLSLAARFEVTEVDMERPQSTILRDEREVALFQIHFYGFLQECLIRGIESEE